MNSQQMPYRAALTIIACLGIMVGVAYSKTHKRVEPIADPVCAGKVAENVKSLNPC